MYECSLGEAMVRGREVNIISVPKMPNFQNLFSMIDKHMTCISSWPLLVYPIWMLRNVNPEKNYCHPVLYIMYMPWCTYRIFYDMPLVLHKSTWKDKLCTFWSCLWSNPVGFMSMWYWPCPITTLAWSYLVRNQNTGGFLNITIPSWSCHGSLWISMDFSEFSWFKPGGISWESMNFQ